MNNAELSEVLKKHIRDVVGDNLKIEKSTSLTRQEQTFLQREVGIFKASSGIHIFDIYSENTILFRCAVAKGVLFISKKKVGARSQRANSASDIDRFTLADPKSIKRAVDAILDHLESSIEILLNRLEPMYAALKSIKEYKNES